MRIVDRTHLSDYPLMAKLTRWGVDFHMGILFGLVNQLLLIAFGTALCVMIVVGYRLWWIRRPARAAAGRVHAGLGQGQGIQQRHPVAQQRGQHAGPAAGVCAPPALRRWVQSANRRKKAMA